MPAPVDQEATRVLREAFGEFLLTPDDAGFDAARTIWNARFDQRPGAIARCRSADDVVAALAVARDHDLLVAVRSGGHDYAGKSTCAEGLVIDLGLMRGIEIDLDRRRVRVEPGVQWAELDAATAAHRLVTTGGTVSSVGVAGFTLGGGSGWLARRHGLALDNLLAAEVVTASGARLRANEQEHADLFWALRGGGGNFGIVTAFELRLHPLPENVLAGQVVHRHAAAGDVLRRYRELLRAAPDELGCYAFFYRAPPIDAFPVDLHGETVVALVAAWTGDPAAGEGALALLRDAGEAVLDTIAPVRYVELQRSFDAGMPKGLRWCSRYAYFDRLADAAIETLVRRTERLPGDASVVYLDPMGGAVGRVGPADTAFPHRNASFGLHVFPSWSEPADDGANVAWAGAFLAEMDAYSNGGVYVNMLGGDEAERVPAAYGRNFSRLQEVKRRYDPENLFRSNQNIPPAD